nr:hypothetical protein [Tanacetum cinerariifolium]
MVIQNQSELGEGSAMTIDPHHTPIILQPSSSQPQKTQKPMKPKRNDTHVPQPSGPTDNVTDEAIHNELGDRLATPNESSSQRTNSGGDPRCQETMRDTTAQTRFKSVSKHSNDSLLARGNTLRSDEDSLKLKELMELCTNLQNMVLDLEKTKTSQWRRIDAIDVDEEITLVNDVDNEMFNVNDLGGEEEERLARERAKKEQEANISLIKTWDNTQAKIDVDHQLVERLQAQEQAELSDAEKATLFQQLLEKRRKHFAAKRAEEKRNKPPTQA